MNAYDENETEVCIDHQYARAIIEVAHRRSNEFSTEMELEDWYEHVWSETATTVCESCLGVPPLVVEFESERAGDGFQPWYWWADKLKSIRAGIEDSEFNPEDKEPWPDRLAWVKHLLSVADPTGAEETVYFGLRVQIGAEEAWGEVLFPDTGIHDVSLELDGVFATEQEYRNSIAATGTRAASLITEADLVHLDIDGDLND